MKRYGCLALLGVLAVLSPSPARAAMSGTAWGVLIGDPQSSEEGIQLTLHVDGVAGGDETIVNCGAWGTWCSSIQSNENVIVSVSQRPLLTCGGVYSNTLLMDGTSKSHYCYPGPCGSSAPVKKLAPKEEIVNDPICGEVFPTCEVGCQEAKPDVLACAKAAKDQGLLLNCGSSSFCLPPSR